MRVAADVTSSNRIEYPTSLPSSQPYSSATLTATVVAATRRGYMIPLANTWPQGEPTRSVVSYLSDAH